jgi:hypothetical protein
MTFLYFGSMLYKEFSLLLSDYRSRIKISLPMNAHHTGDTIVVSDGAFQDLQRLDPERGLFVLLEPKESFRVPRAQELSGGLVCFFRTQRFDA